MFRKRNLATKHFCSESQRKRFKRCAQEQQIAAIQSGQLFSNCTTSEKSLIDRQVDLICRQNVTTGTKRYSEALTKIRLWSLVHHTCKAHWARHQLQSPLSTQCSKLPPVHKLKIYGPTERNSKIYLHKRTLACEEFTHDKNINIKL